MKIKYLVIIFTVYTLTSCHFFGQDARMTLAWYNREMILPSGLTCKMMGKDTVCTFQTKKWKIFTYIDTIGCSTCNFRALDWKRIIHEADSITSNVTFIFYAHLKNYEEFEVYTGINRFNYPIFYDYEGKCDRQNHLPDDVFYQTFLLDENNKVQLIGKPIPDSKLWELYKKIITQ